MLRSHSASLSSDPVVELHGGIFVVRDDLYPGGTKARFIGELVAGAREVVYATPAEGGAQVALATVCRARRVKLTLFVAKRSTPHPRSLQAKALGATVYQVAPGYLTVVQKRAIDYAAVHEARLLPFGLDVPQAIARIAEAAIATGISPKEVWCAAGSGVLMRGLRRAWPYAIAHAVQVGRELRSDDVAGARVHRVSLPFSRADLRPAPFPSDPHYDAKAWHLCRELARESPVLFWNVAAPAPTPA